MPNSASRSTRVACNLVHVAFCVDLAGEILCIDGPAMPRVLAAPSWVQTACIFELYHDRPDLLKLWQDALRGIGSTTDVHWGGMLWRVEWQPVKRGRDIIGGLCTAHLLDAEPIPAPEPWVRVWRLTDGGYGYAAESEVMEVDGVRSLACTSTMPRGIFQRLMDEGKLEPVATDRRSTPPASAPPREVLRIVP